jgi:tetratricopeptide (TPR) repeat protein
MVEIVARAQHAFAAGRLAEAEFNCRLVLSANKKQFDALHLLGSIEFQHGRFEEAQRLIRQAVRINPGSAAAHSNLALVLQQLNQLDHALINLDKALALDPNFLLALNSRGHVLWRLKRPEEALESLDRVLALKPDYVDALCNRGNVLVELKRLDEALTYYDKALAIIPNDAPTLNNRANVLWALNRRDEAMQNYDCALSLSPNDLSILKDRGSALHYLQRSEEALECFDHALVIKPNDPYFLYKRGSALAHLDRHEDALASLDRAFELAPDADALSDRGNVLSALQRHGEAIASYDRALGLAPDSALTHWNRGLALLRAGNYEEGWQEYEWRSKLERLSASWRQFAQPQWLGELPVNGKTILLFSEQGFGDAIQFARYVPLVAALGAKVILQVQPALKKLLVGIDGAATIVDTDEGLPLFDLQCPLMSLPLAFKTTLDTIPAKEPYLSVPPERLAAWKTRLPQSLLPRVGIVWAGNPNFPLDRSRSIGLRPLLPLLSVPGVQFISLQKDLRDGDGELLRQHPQFIHLGDQLEEFSDTAAIMSLLDLVISSDTAPAHLAGALGRPVWVLLQKQPDWRWMFEREDCPWYPSARLFRQPTVGDWDGVVGQVEATLNSWLRRRDG